MTSDLNRSLPAQAFQPAEPEPAGPLVGEPSVAAEPSMTLPLPGAPAEPSRRSRMIVNAVLAAAFVVLVGGVAFAIGRATAPTAAAADLGNGAAIVDDGFRPGDGNQLPGGAPFDRDGDRSFGPGAAGTSVRGTVTALGDGTMTIQLANGASLQVALDSNTDYHRRADASASDVTTGTTVIVGVDGPRLDGSAATATDVTIVP